MSQKFYYKKIHTLGDLTAKSFAEGTNNQVCTQPALVKKIICIMSINKYILHIILVGLVVDPSNIGSLLMEWLICSPCITHSV
jgi:hypothetical protein